MISNMKRFALLIAAIALVCAPAEAQNMLGRLKERAKNAVENNIGNKIEQGVNDIFNGKKKEKGEKEEKSKKKAKDDNYTTDEVTGPIDDTPDAVAQNQKSDFVRGSVILFEDDFANEQIGEFPSKWDIDGGSAEVASINGKKYLNFTDDWNSVAPLMTNMESYLPDVFTLEWDVFYSKVGDYGQSDLDVHFMKKGSWNDQAGNVALTYRPWGPDSYGGYRFEKGEGATGDVNGSLDWNQIKDFVKIGQWNHFAVSFNKRAFKFYINGNRVINLPNAKAPERIMIICVGDYKYRGFTNVVLAAGAKDLYERQTTDLSAAAAAVEKAIEETGKFVTNNILFETGKADLKPESMSEIQKVAEYMKANPSARFEVQGHTDNQGSDKVNDPLSQQRAEAVVKALEEQGVDPFNLRPVGKGSHEPVADNKTDEGRSKNRRVEFIKK